MNMRFAHHTTLALVGALLLLGACASSAPSIPSPPSPPKPPGASSPGAPAPGAPAPSAQPAATPPSPSAPSVPSPPSAGARTAGEEGAALDDQLRQSLSDFDRTLQREQEILEQRRVARQSGGTPGGAASGGGGDSAGDDGSGDDTSNAGAVAVDEPAGSRSAEQGDDEALASRIPPDIPDGKDDDIVARQLREAAMSEEDPELREKLWQEYRDYKKGSG